MIKKKILGKKAVSPVISTTLLIVISVIVVLIIAGVVIPFVRKGPGEAKKCFDALEQVIIDTESEYTCYYNVTNEKIVNITVKRGMKELALEGFMIPISGGGSAKTFEIKEGTVEDVKMLNGSTNIELPRKGEKRTYSIDTGLTEIDYAEIAPILQGGKVCDPADKADIEKCAGW